MNYHGIRSPVVTDVGSMFDDPGVEASSCFTKIGLIATAAGYAIYCTVGVAFQLLLVSYHIVYIFPGCAGDFHCFSKVFADRLGNVTWRQYEEVRGCHWG